MGPIRSMQKINAAHESVELEPALKSDFAKHTYRLINNTYLCVLWRGHNFLSGSSKCYLFVQAGSGVL